MSDQVWPSVQDAIHSRIEEEIKSQTHSMACGQCPNYETYQRLVGRIAGLQFALDIFDDVFNRWKNQ